MGPWSALLVIVIHMAVGGVYLASVVAPNHKGMMQTDDNSRLDFLPAQVLTSRNIRGSWWADIICGSLNYQTEHHLFPTMPRNRMTQANKIVREYCEQVRVAYHDTSMLRSYGELLGFLHTIGAPLQLPRPVVPPSAIGPRKTPGTSWANPCMG